MSRTYKRYTRQEDLAIAQLMAEGRTVKEIAAIREMPAKIVEYRIDRLRKKEGAVSTVHLISMLIVNFHIAPRIEIGKSQN